MTDSVRQRLNRVEELTRQMHTLHQRFEHPDTAPAERRQLHRQMRTLYIESIAACQYAFLGILESIDSGPPSAEKMPNKPPGVLPVIWGRAINYPKVLILVILFSLIVGYPVLV
jgi:hypothetical protein